MVNYISELKTFEFLITLHKCGQNFELGMGFGKNVGISIDENVKIVLHYIVAGSKIVVKRIDPAVDVSCYLNILRLGPYFCHFMPAKVRWLDDYFKLSSFDF